MNTAQSDGEVFPLIACPAEGAVARACTHRHLELNDGRGRLLHQPCLGLQRPSVIHHRRIFCFRSRNSEKRDAALFVHEPIHPLIIRPSIHPSAYLWPQQRRWIFCVSAGSLFSSSQVNVLPSDKSGYVMSFKRREIFWGVGGYCNLWIFI